MDAEHWNQMADKLFGASNSIAAADMLVKLSRMEPMVYHVFQVGRSDGWSEERIGLTIACLMAGRVLVLVAENARINMERPAGMIFKLTDEQATILARVWADKSPPATEERRELISALRFLHASASPVPWDNDSVKSEGEYGAGDETHSGFDAQKMFATIYGKDVAIFDSLSSEFSEVIEEGRGTEDFQAFDVVARRNFELMATMRNALPKILQWLDDAPRVKPLPPPAPPPVPADTINRNDDDGLGFVREIDAGIAKQKLIDRAKEVIGEPAWWNHVRLPMEWMEKAQRWLEDAGHSDGGEQGRPPETASSTIDMTTSAGRNVELVRTNEELAKVNVSLLALVREARDLFTRATANDHVDGWTKADVEEYEAWEKRALAAAPNT